MLSCECRPTFYLCTFMNIIVMRGNDDRLILFSPQHHALSYHPTMILISSYCDPHIIILLPSNYTLILISQFSDPHVINSRLHIIILWSSCHHTLSFPFISLYYDSHIIFSYHIRVLFCRSASNMSNIALVARGTRSAKFCHCLFERLIRRSEAHQRMSKKGLCPRSQY